MPSGQGQWWGGGQSRGRLGSWRKRPVFSGRASLKKPVKSTLVPLFSRPRCETLEKEAAFAPTPNLKPEWQSQLHPVSGTAKAGAPSLPSVQG